MRASENENGELECERMDPRPRTSLALCLVVSRRKGGLRQGSVIGVLTTTSSDR
jgi:hypothetical protein